MNSEHHLHQQVRCTCCIRVVFFQNAASVFKLSLSSRADCCVKALSMPPVRLVFLTTLLVVLAAVLISGARTTRWPKPQNTKKPPRAGARITTTPSNNMHTDETTEGMMDAFTLSPTDSTTYPADTYPTEFHTDAIVPPGNPLGNYTLDYSECFFNFCECCPPEKGPVGPMGEKGPPGPPGERGPLGKVDYHSGKLPFGGQN